MGQEDILIRNQRKNEHIYLASQMSDGPSANGFEHVHLLHDSVPELDIEQIESGLRFMGHNLNCPLVINAITGGTRQAGHINEVLAILAARYDIAMAVGSQTIALHNPGLKDTFKIVRDFNPDGLIFANINAHTPVDKAKCAIDMINADALQVHFNVPQELAMSEGDRSFTGILDNIRNLVDYCGVPVIAKEVGFGFSRETALCLYNAGITIFDNGGMGGTNFIAIEDSRSGYFNGELNEWGIPTAISLAEMLSLNLPMQIIASGGIRTAVDAVKALSMGASLFGIAGSLLKILLEQGETRLDTWLSEFIYRLKAVMLMTGSQNIDQLRNKPLIILGETAEWLRTRGIDTGKWVNR